MSALIIPLPGAAHAPVVQTRRAGRWPKMVICYAGAKYLQAESARRIEALREQSQDYRQRADSCADLQRLALHQAAIFEAQAIELATRAKRLKGAAIWAL